jgi:ABC-type Fe3+/spermidine/putrescine transport system ATPase subunit
MRVNEAIPCLEIRSLSKAYGNHTVVDGVDISIQPGEIFSLLGPSGAGKSTILKAILGLVKQDEGRIVIEGRDVTEVPTGGRPVGMVFQDYSLFPTMTVRDNVAYPLIAREVRGIASLIRFQISAKRGEVLERADEMLRLVQLEPHARKRPHQLSGGEQQRVALARALIASPKLLCLDEPFSALDKNLRVEMQQELVRLKDKVGTTLFYVTHDQTEAMLLSDRLAIIKGGQIKQTGPPREVYCKPASEFVARFLGECNILPIISCGDGAIITRDGHRIFTAEAICSEHVSVGIRPENLTTSEGDGRTKLQATVEARDFLGSSTRLRVRLSETVEMLVTLSSGDRNQFPGIGERIDLYYLPEHVFLLKADKVS